MNALDVNKLIDEWDKIRFTAFNDMSEIVKLSVRSWLEKYRISFKNHLIVVSCNKQDVFIECYNLRDFVINENDSEKRNVEMIAVDDRDCISIDDVVDYNFPVINYLTRLQDDLIDIADYVDGLEFKAWCFGTPIGYSYDE